MNFCLCCQKETSNPKFCSRSCSASFNNRGKRKHGKERGVCCVCSKPKSSSAQKYCSNKCSSVVRKLPVEYLRAKNAENQSRYRQKKFRKIHPSANKQIMIEIYKNCPNGYEVDHITPLSKGGLHHQDNLQYLTKFETRKKSNKMVQEAGIEPARPFDRRL